MSPELVQRILEDTAAVSADDLPVIGKIIADNLAAAGLDLSHEPSLEEVKTLLVDAVQAARFKPPGVSA